MTRPKLGKCQVGGCQEKAKWGIYKTFPNGTKCWLNVCDLHEKQIGSENLGRAGGYLDPRQGKVGTHKYSRKNT